MPTFCMCKIGLKLWLRRVFGLLVPGLSVLAVPKQF